MFGLLIRKVIGTKNDRELKRLAPMVEQISAFEPALSSLDDEQLRSKTEEFRSRLASGASLDDVLPEAFAVVRETSKRRLGMRHFDVQLLGGIVLHEGKISEMKTGEGKTLVATLPLYLNALPGLGAHLVTVNDYLAKRDAQWMGPIYHALGLSVGVIQHEAAFRFDPTYEAADRRLQYLRPVSRPEAYHSDITYGTNNEFGFDYLRDNMTVDLSQGVQRELHYAIVDEVDSILIDEARTPLIISGPTEESTDKYYRINQIIPSLKETEDYTVEEKTKTVTLTEEGNAKVERLLGVSNLYDLSNMELVHHVIQGLKAHTLFNRDVDYVVKDGEVMIVDEFTGRLMPGRRWSDGLHQAVEAKEGVKIANENQTLASITFQNYFRLYKKLAGMTGTADTEAAEFAKIYNLDVMVIPPNRNMIRKDYADVVYRTEHEKFNAIVEEAAELHQKGQPVLVGTISIEKSERLSGLLKRQGVKHSVLNAKYHEKEAEIIAQAGSKGAVTIATNMAGRGTDILLGGNPDFLFKRHLIQQPEMPPAEQNRLFERIKKECETEKAEVVTLGGLHILGTERHESRRIDNQLRGRAGRQGDPGSSRFYLSLEDDLMRIFGSERISGLMQRLGMEEGIPIEHRMVTRAIENAQKKVEAHNFDIRKQLLEYDDVMNKQREVIYEQRRRVLRGENLTDLFLGMIDDRLNEILELYCPEGVYPEEWDVKGLNEALVRQFTMNPENEAEMKELGRTALRENLVQKIDEAYKKKEAELGEPLMRQLEKMVMLRVIDAQWKDHLLAMDYMKEGIGLRGYGQKDPLVEYKREGFGMFAALMERIKNDAVEHLFKIQVVKDQPAPTPRPAAAPPPQKLQFSRGDAPAQSKTAHRDVQKVGRNDPCPCGSGKKYKKCHGQ
ncbi:MAG TPA: preprotein translocase subunit SecA [Nitrospiria bacterium]|nr:preprotein translocase subunit SecA [Nitrospiria bacterium]